MRFSVSDTDNIAGYSHLESAGIHSFHRVPWATIWAPTRDEGMAKKTTASILNTTRDAAEAEIKAKQREVKYDLRDFVIDYIVNEFKSGLFFVPDYQRRFVWDVSRQCRFIESVILGLPIPRCFCRPRRRPP